MDLDINMEFDLLDSDADKKQSQKRPRRRVVVETKDSNGRPYTQAEIRRMKRCGMLSMNTAHAAHRKQYHHCLSCSRIAEFAVIFIKLKMRRMTNGPVPISK